MEPTYQGRRLAKPEEAVFDQGLAFDLGTLVSRRKLLSMLGLGAAAASLAACGDGSSSSTNSAASSAAWTGEISEEIVGPYPADGSNGPDALEKSGIIRSDIRSSFGDSTTTAEGIPMTLELTVTDIAGGGNPFTGVAIYIWQCDRAGQYSLYSEGVTKENYLRGVQIADSAGKVKFTSIFPACYKLDGALRWPHIHFEVYPDQASITDSTKAIATSQIAMPENFCTMVYKTTGYEQSATNMTGLTLKNDIVFGDDGAAHEIPTVTGDVTSGFAASLAFGVDTTTKAGTGSMVMPSGFPSGGFPSGGFPSGGFPSGGFPSGGFPSGFPGAAPSATS